MRCSTPIIRVSLIGLSEKLPSWMVKKGNQYMRYPNKKIRNVRLSTFPKNAPSSSWRYFSIEKLIAFPTANKKDGKTRSVGVNPCQLACRKGPNGVAPSPGVFTIIMKHTVSPRKTSRARKRVADLILFNI